MWTSPSFARSASFRTGTLWLVTSILSGCAGPVIPMRMPQAQAQERPIEVGTRVRERFDSATGSLLRRWHVTTSSDGVPLLDGTDESWWPDDTRRHDRNWSLGEEIGQWYSWHANGVLRSSADFDTKLGTMRFWHPNGLLSAEGLHQRGTRSGVWTFWHENGVPQAEGPFVTNRREGAWTFWSEDGEIEAAGVYAAGQRVGDWYLAPNGLAEPEHGS